jgi:hypothetical protein
MESYKEWNDLQAGLAMVCRDKDEKHETKAAGKKREAEQKATKKAELEAAERAKKAVLLPELQEDITKGVDHISSLYCPRLKDILLYLYELPKKDVGKMNKASLLKAISDKQTSP